MDPLEQYTGFTLLWIFLSSILVFVFGIGQTIFISKRLGISQRKGILIYLWHTLICIVHYQWVVQVGESDVFGTYLQSIKPFSSLYLNEYGSNVFILYFFRIFSYYLKFSLFTTFLVLNILGTNAILLIEYFYRKLSINFTRNLKFVLGLFIWLPTLHFWTSLGKDSLLVLSILLIIYSLENLKKRFLFFIPSLIIITIVRNYISIMIIASVILSIFLNSSSIKQSSKIGLLIFAFISLYFVFPIFNAFLFDGDFQNINSVLEVITYNARMTSMGSYAIDPNANFFSRIFAYSFRPLFFDVRNPFGLVLSFDNFILLILFLYSFIYMVKLRCLRLSFKNQISIFCASFSLSTALLLSLSTSNLGIAARHKYMFLPVIFILILRIFQSAFIKKSSNNIKSINLKSNKFI